MDPLVTAAISLLSATVGAILGGAITQLREWWKEKQQKRRVATAIASEVMAQADVTITCASLANLAEFGLRQGEGLRTRMLINLLPPEAVAFKSLVSQLPLFDAATVSRVIAYNGSLQWAARVSSAHEESEAYPPDHVQVLGHSWRAAAFNGLAALNAILRHSAPILLEVDERHVDELRRGLRAVIERQSPYVQVNEDGSLAIGRGRDA